MNSKIKAIVSNKKIIILIYFLFALIASVQALLGGRSSFEKDGIEHNNYNNYDIFENSFYHLVEQKDLYILYPYEHWDLFKYSPSFAALFGVFSIFPDWIGLPLWTLLNSFVLLFAIYYLPKLNSYQQGLILLIILIELLTSLQNQQSNGLMAGLFVLSFGMVEKQKYFLASLFLVTTVFIKLFGVVGFALFLFYPQKWKLALYSLTSSLILFLIPLLFIDFDQYLFLLKSYANMLSNDYSISYGFSVMGWLFTWFGLEFDKMPIVLLGVFIFLLPFVRIKEYKEYIFRILALTSILIWVVIFNHKAESPTFIIAMSGVAIWFVISEKSKINILLFSLAFIFTTLSPTDLFPKIIRDSLVIPYTLKAFPCILIWLKIIYDMITLKTNTINEKYSFAPQI